jgi:hypothetical protein
VDNDKEFDSFDDLFEPFELEEGPPPPESPSSTSYEPPQKAEAPVAQIDCPSCGTPNPAYNRHCEQCGARLTKEPLPIAPAPMGRTTPGAKALGVLVGVVLIVLLLAGLRSIWRSDSGEAQGTSTSTTTSSTEAIATVQLVPTSVEASSTLPGYPADNLIDGDPATEWQDQSLGGEDAVLTFRFAQPVAITYIEIQGITGDLDRFRLNYRMKGYEITVDDNELQFTNTVPDDPGPHRIEIASQETNRLELHVLSTYASEPVGDKLPFEELVIAEVSFFGHPADQ